MPRRIVIADLGRGPVEGATEAEAERNAFLFVEDLRHLLTGWVPGLRRVTRDDRDRGGRFAFDIIGINGIDVEVLIPGLPAGRVRWWGGPGIYEFPRLCVNGDWFAWKFAAEVTVCWLNAKSPPTVDPTSSGE